MNTSGNKIHAQKLKKYKKKKQINNERKGKIHNKMK